MSLYKPCPINYPKELRANLEYRTALFHELEKDPRLQHSYKLMCKKDILYWVNTSCWTRDPDKYPADIPFITFDEFQDDFILSLKTAIENGEDICLEKSRRMGASWMVLYVFQWFWQFHPGSDFRCGSWKEDYVDKIGDMGTLFEKLRFNLKRQPAWLLPKGFDPYNKNFSSFCRLVNPENQNSIIGESANPTFGSAARTKGVLFDEFSKWEPNVAESAWTATGDVTKCRIAVATPYGSGNKYAELASGQSGVKIKVHTTHWTLHPEKNQGAYYISGGQRVPIDMSKDKRRAFKVWLLNRGKTLKNLKGGVVRSPWYDAECERRTDREIAQELDIDYLRSGNPFFEARALSRQQPWEPFERNNPYDPIPYGKYIIGKVVRVGSKLEFREDPNGWCRIFEFPKPGRQYAQGADTSEGLPKGDLSVSVVREKITTNTVATIVGHHSPEDFGELIWLLHRFYFDCLTAPENNNHGYTTCKEFYDYGGNLYYTIKEQTKEGDRETPKRGFTTDRSTRLPGLDLMSKQLNAHSTEIRDPDIISHCKTFIRPEKTPNHPEADGTFKDDGVMAFMICGYVIEKKPYVPVKNKDQKRRVKIEKMQSTKNAGYGFKQKVSA